MDHQRAMRTAGCLGVLLVGVLGGACQCGPASVTTGGNGGGKGGGDAGLAGGTGGSSGTGGSTGGGLGGSAGTGGGSGGGTGGSAGAAACTGNGQCPGGAPRCDPALHRCVECVRASDCPTARPVCDPATNTCEAACKSSASCVLPRPVCDAQVGTCIEGRCEFEGACAAWRRGAWSACSGGTCWGGGGTRTRTVACIDGMGAPSTTCPQPAPPASEACFDVTTCPVDAGQPPVDAGQPPVDAGQPPVDAGQPPVDAGQPPVDAGQPHVDAGTPDAGPPELCAPSGTAVLSPTACHVTVLMKTLVVNNPTCYVDVAAHPTDTAELYWDCGVSIGRAELRFPTLTAAGAWNAPTLSVCFGTHFPWSDGCQWQSAQRVEGSPTRGSILQFTYEERPNLGQSGCVSPCWATGTFEVL